jgi:hypothetical protein
LKILEAYNHRQSQVTSFNDPSENIRRRKAREHAKEIYQEVNTRRDDFFQNTDIKSGHASKIEHI